MNNERYHSGMSRREIRKRIVYLGHSKRLRDRSKIRSIIHAEYDANQQEISPEIIEYEYKKSEEERAEIDRELLEIASSVKGFYLRTLARENIKYDEPYGTPTPIFDAVLNFSALTLFALGAVWLFKSCEIKKLPEERPQNKTHLEDVLKEK